MRPSKARFVTACQQMLALATVLAVLAPATNVISLDVVITRPGASTSKVAEHPVLKDRPDRRATKQVPKAARVETEPVDPEVTEVPMQATPVAARRAPDRRDLDKGGEEPAAGGKLISAPEPVEGFGAVGITWSGEQEFADDRIELSVRTRTGDTWSAWQPVEYHDEHQPDPDSQEARDVRPGTDPLVVGEVDAVQARAVTADGTEPVDMKLAVIAPGESEDTAVEPGDIEIPTTAASAPEHDDSVQLQASGQATEEPTQEAAPEGEPALEDETGLDLESAVAARPAIYSRAQWGANERLRSGSPRYGTIAAGFVHHTVNANGYSAGQVPGIIRSIYAYHTQSRGWSDIGYNFLVDRFGRIWEGRYGGVTRPVIGAHTSGYNQYSFAMSAIGNFETAQPTSAIIQAYGRLMGWKLSLHNVNAADTSQRLGSRYFKAINGHRDAGSTACPGRYLYAKLPQIRYYARQAQLKAAPAPAPKPVDRRRMTNLVGSSHPDLVLRRKDGQGFVLPTSGMFRFRAGVSSTGYGGYNLVVSSPDLTGDGRGDLVVQERGTGLAGVRPGNGAGKFGATIRKGHFLRARNAVTATGDLDGDRRNDLVTREFRTGRLWFYRGNGNATFTRIPLTLGWNAYNLIAASGDLTGDGKRDLIGRNGAGQLWVHRGLGNGRFGTRVSAGGGWAGFDRITGFGDWNGDGRADLLARLKSNGHAYIFPGRGNGTFGHWLGPFPGLQGMQFLSGGGHFTGSREPDAVGVRSGTLTVAPHAGTFHTRRLVPAKVNLGAVNLLLNAGDWNRDGKGDVITRRASTGNVELRLGRGDGTFQSPAVIATSWSKWDLLAGVGDVTGDGKPDLIAQPEGWTLRTYPGNGTARLSGGYPAGPTESANARHVGLGLWNGDAIPDSLFRIGDQVKWYASSADGKLSGGQVLPHNFAGYDWLVTPGDVDGDKRPDLVAREQRTGYLWLFRGVGSRFGGRIFLAEGFGGYDLAG